MDDVVLNIPRWLMLMFYDGFWVSRLQEQGIVKGVEYSLLNMFTHMQLILQIPHQYIAYLHWQQKESINRTSDSIKYQHIQS